MNSGGYTHGCFLCVTELAFGSKEFRQQQEAAAKAASESGKTAKVCDTGSVQGDYSAEWTTTFDFYFLIFMIFLCIILIVVTEKYEPKLWTCADGTFWFVMLGASLAQMAVGIFGGLLARYSAFLFRSFLALSGTAFIAFALIARYYCLMDENNMYTITSPKSYFKVIIRFLFLSPTPSCFILHHHASFYTIMLHSMGCSRSLTHPILTQVNYTRKLQHLAAYVIPLVITPPGSITVRVSVRVSVRHLGHHASRVPSPHEAPPL